MFDIDICEPRRIILVRFRGQLTEADFVELDRLGTELRGERAFDCIYDMTDIKKFDLATSFVARRGDPPQTYEDHERIYVVSNDDLKLLVRLYAAYQVNKGWKEPVIVASLSEAMDKLDVSHSDFRPVPPAKR
jgi:hypothetical protein